ncbi:MAG: hypothetical protein IJM56_01985, partial [Clostridia bacterium]|nr:hypothetical protein [Clostridia bacterium]
MNAFACETAAGKLTVSVYAENVVRVRLSRDAKPSLFERYGIFSGPDSDAGETLKNGVKSGELTVRCEDGSIFFETPRVRRKISLVNDQLSLKRAFFEEKTANFRPERKQIVGDESTEKICTVDFLRDPKYFTLETKGERFYGLGESNVDRLVLNERTYLMRVLYTRS